MRRFHLLYLIGIMLLFIACTMCFPLAWSLFDQGADCLAFIKAIAFTVISGFLLYWSGKPKKGSFELSIVENYTLVALAWFIAGLFAALPYYFFGVFEGSFIDAFFEAVSGLTTTGATLIEDIEALPRGLLLWRAFTQWLGGMGIIVLFLAILPRFGFRSMTMFKAETPGPVAERVVPRVAETAKRLWLVYVSFTALQVLLLLLAKINFYDALTHAFATMSTGGFSVYQASVAAFNNPAAEVIITVFMFLAGVNFVLYYRLIRGDLAIFKNPELRFYCTFVLIATIFVTANIYRATPESFAPALRQGAFQVVSIITTTGFVTANYDLWPHFSRLLLLMLMFVGACGGSTSGSMKQARWMLMWKYSLRELRLMVHPSAITSIKLGDHHVEEDVLRSVMGYGIFYFILTAVATLLLTLMELDLSTAFSAVATTIGNIGPGFSRVGPLYTFQAVPHPGRLLLAIMMIVGRLEIFTALVIFLPESRQLWKKAFTRSR